jgi:hypothetical protein
MSDVQRPPVLTLLAVLAIITGIFSLIRGGLLIFGGISQVMDGVVGIAEILIGVLGLAVAVLGIISGARVLLNKAGGVALLWKFAIAMLGYTLIWVIYRSVTGGMVSWISVLVELAISAVTLAIIKTGEEIKAYLESAG